MESQQTESSSISEKKKALRTKAVIQIIIGIVTLLVAIAIYSAGIEGGIIFALVSLTWLVFLIMGVVNLIRGYSGKKTK